MARATIRPRHFPEDPAPDRHGEARGPVRVTVLTRGWVAALLTAAGALVVLAGKPPRGPAPRALLDGHPGPVRALAFSADGKTLTVSTTDGAFTLWDAGSGRRRAVVHGQAGWGYHAALSDDGSDLAEVNGADEVMLRDVAGDRVRVTGPGNGVVHALAFSPDGAILAAVDDAGVTFRDAASGRELAGLRLGLRDLTCLAISPDGRSVVTGGRDGMIRRWDLAAMRQGWATRAHARHVSSMAFSSDGHRLVSTGNLDQVARLWDAAAGRPLAALRGHAIAVPDAAFAPDGRVVATAGADREVRLWDASTGRELAVLSGHEGWVYAVAFSPDGRTLASGGGDRTVRLWDVAEWLGARPGESPGHRRVARTSPFSHSAEAGLFERPDRHLTSPGTPLND